jgi:hypothetical protein
MSEERGLLISFGSSTPNNMNPFSSSPISLTPAATTTVNPFERPAPVECYKLTILGYGYSVVFVLSVILNALLLWLFYLYKELRTPLNHFIIAITSFHFFGSILEFPMVIKSNLYCR